MRAFLMVKPLTGIEDQRVILRRRAPWGELLAGPFNEAADLAPRVSACQLPFTSTFPKCDVFPVKNSPEILSTAYFGCAAARKGVQNLTSNPLP